MRIPFLLCYCGTHKAIDARLEANRERADASAAVSTIAHAAQRDVARMREDATETIQDLQREVVHNTGAYSNQILEAALFGREKLKREGEKKEEK